MLSRVPGFRVEYFEVVEPVDMQPVAGIAGPVRIAAAAYLGPLASSTTYSRGRQAEERSGQEQVAPIGLNYCTATVTGALVGLSPETLGM